MSTYQRYQDARDVAWRTLLRFGVRAMPVDVRAIAQGLGYSLHPFPDPKKEPRLHAQAARAMGSAVCVSLRLGREWHGFLAPGITEESHIRFALAHELGHLLLSHATYALSPGVRAFQGRENAGDLLNDPQELDDYAADIFAIRLLAPACVLKDLHADTPGKIAGLCQLPPRAAALRAERMELLIQRNAFFSHPLERQLYDRFRPYLARSSGIRPADAFPLSLSPARDFLVLPDRSSSLPGRKKPPSGRTSNLEFVAPMAQTDASDASEASCLPAQTQVRNLLEAPAAKARPAAPKMGWLFALAALGLGAAVFALCWLLHS